MVVVRSGVNTRGNPKAGGGNASAGATVTSYAALTNSLQKDVNSIMKAAGKVILEAARNNVAVDTGALRESGRVVLERTNKGTRAAVLFGGEDFPVTPTRNTRGGVNGDGVVDYAFFVHEGISPSGVGAGTSAKYLERAVMETQSQVKDLIVNRLKKTVKRKRGKLGGGRK